MPQGERRTLDVVSENMDLVQIFESQGDGILVTKVTGKCLQVVWKCFQRADELSYIRNHFTSLKYPVECCWEGVSEVNYTKILVPLNPDRIKEIARKAKVELSGTHVILLKCDFTIVRNSIHNAYALFCKEYLSRNGLGTLFIVYTPDDETCTQWADLLLTSYGPYGREWHTARIHRMMHALFAQGYCLSSDRAVCL